MSKTRLNKSLDLCIDSIRSRIASEKLESMTDYNPFEEVNPRLIHLIQNENGQQYVLNGKWIKSAFESRYCSKFMSGKLRFVLPNELDIWFPAMKNFSLETLEWDLVEPLCPKKIHSLGTKSFLHDFSRYNYPYICHFGKVCVLSKEKYENIKPEVIKYINTCYNTISKLIEDKIDLIDIEFKEERIFQYTENFKPHFSQISMLYNDRREFEGTEFHEEYIKEIDKYLIEVYNRRTLRHVKSVWIRYILSCLNNCTTKFVATIAV